MINSRFNVPLSSYEYHQLLTIQFLMGGPYTNLQNKIFQTISNNREPNSKYLYYCGDLK